VVLEEYEHAKAHVVQKSTPEVVGFMVQLQMVMTWLPQAERVLCAV